MYLYRQGRYSTALYEVLDDRFGTARSVGIGKISTRGVFEEVADD